MSKIDSKMASAKVIICDIEGTTSAISFVKENLFPFAEKNVDKFLADNWETVQPQVEALRTQYQKDVADKVEGAVEIVDSGCEKEKQIESIVANVKWQMSLDRKVGALKELQGLIWVGGYKDKSFTGHVYEDVAPALESWSTTGHKIYIYSSGSDTIQKVHFAHSEAGDLSKYLSGYFDTKVGMKQEKSSYEKIANQIGKELEEDLKPEDMLFLTDVVKEAEAAQECGMNVIVLKRPGNAELTEEEEKKFTVVDNFKDIVLDSVSVATKRKVEEACDEKTESPPTKVAKIEEEVKQPAEEKKETEQEETKKKEEETAQVETIAPEKLEEDEPMAEAKEETDSKVVVEEEKTEEMPTTKVTEKEEEKMETEEAVAVEKEEISEVKLVVEEETKKVPTEVAEPKVEEIKEATSKEEEKEPAKEQLPVVEESKNEEEEKKDKEDNKVIEVVKENGDAKVTAETKEEIIPDEKTNGEAKVTNETETTPPQEEEKKNGENGTANGNESDKENDKAVENDEPAIAEVPAAEVIVKKCTAEPPVTSAAPEVEAES